MATTLTAHILSQIEHNIHFLQQHGHISKADADSVINTLSGATGRAVPPPPPPRLVTASLPQARALWDYNENNQDPSDLSFRKLDIIEIVSEVNDDWWMGRANGREALFPANYVERVSADSASATAVVAPHPAAPAPVPAGGARRLPPMQPQQKTPYKPFMAAHHGGDAPPADGGVNSVGLRHDTAGQAEKKSKYGKYGNTMADSAARGVGFGAGAAIGGGLVRAIF